MRLTLDALTVLDAIERKGSFAAAADELHRVPSAVSYTVQKLEQDLNISVYDRTGHRAVLTSAGKELLEQGRHLLIAAHELEERVKRVSTGWETELSIAVDSLIPLAKLYPLLNRFYQSEYGTRIRLTKEVLGGSWEALINHRADLVIGATGDAPSNSSYEVFTLGEVEMVFVVSPQHPLATAAEPISTQEIQKYRAVAVADSSRNMPPRTAELLSGQDVLTVADMPAKLEAHCQGLGVGTIPKNIAIAEIDAGRLLIKQTNAQTAKPKLQLAWHAERHGKALKWFLQQLKDSDVIQSLLN